MVKLFLNTNSDRTGCGYYRQLFINDALRDDKHMDEYRFISYDKAYIRDEVVFKFADSYRLQRVGLNQSFSRDYFTKFLAPMRDKYGFKIIVDFDDAILIEDCPLYNIGRGGLALYEKESVKEVCNIADYITVTTSVLKDYMIGKFSVAEDKIVVIDNYLPSWWFSGTYSEDRRIENYRKMSKPRIMFSCGSSHFDMNGIAGYDDFSGIQQWIIDNRQKYQFIFHGGMNRGLWEYKDSFICMEKSSFLNYPYAREQYRPHVLIMPLQDNLHNRCKSAIRLYEADAQGVPILLQDMPPYSGKSDLVFSDVDELQSKLDKLLSDEDFYMKEVHAGRDRYASHLLEDHVDQWKKLMLKK